MRSDCEGNLLKKFMGRAGNGSRNLGCRNIYTPSSTATTWNGVTYRIIAVTKQKLMKIAVALYTQQQLSITPSWLKSDLWIQWKEKQWNHQKRIERRLGSRQLRRACRRSPMVASSPSAFWIRPATPRSLSYLLFNTYASHSQ